MDKYFRFRIVAQSVLMLYNTISKKLVFLSIVKKRGVLKMIDEKNIKGIKIRSFNTYMILLAFVLYGMLLYATAQMTSRYDDFIRYNDEYIACHESAVEMNEASDYLTDQVRLFTQNMGMQYMHNYFKEAHETQRREKALANLQKYRPTENELQALLAAKNSSMALMEREIYAMKLIALANGYDEAQLPAEVCQVQLLEVDKNLSSEAMIARARELVYNRSYMDAKAAIKSHSDTFVNKLMRRTAGEQKDSMLALDKSIFNQRLLISLLFVMNVLTFLVITVLIVRPLKMHMKSIREKRSMQTTGAYEFNYFAQTYNEMYELNEANKAMLEHKAMHDPLTGLMNRNAFEGLKDYLKQSHKPMALLLLDVDKFKGVNDTYGHDMGDKVLQKVGHLLQGSFRSGDYPVRIGGDEFLVILNDFDEVNRSTIKRKLELITWQLEDTADGLPQVTLSVGVAFSKQGYNDELFNQADAALYAVKAAGRNGLKFFDELA